MKRTLFLIIFVGLLLSACGQGEPEVEVAELPTNTAEIATETAVPTDTPPPEPTETPIPTDTPTPIPTDTPEPTNTPTPTPDPLGDYTTFSNAEKQFAMQHPKDWFVLDDPGSGMIIMASDPVLLSSDTFDEGTMAFMIVESSGIADANPEEVITGFVSNLDGGLVYDLEPLQEFENLTINDEPAGFVEYSAKMVDGDTAVTFFAAAVLGDESTALMFGFSGPDVYEEAGREEIANVINSVQFNAEIAEVELDSIYFVSSYDPERDPAEDVAEAVTVAEEAGKRILLIVGGDWCITCHLLDSYIAANESVAAQLTENFVMLKINFSEENENEAFLSEYPEIEWYPHFYILESDGTLAESYDTRELETDGLYDDDKFADFLDKWSQGESNSKSDSFYLVKSYDPARDPFADVETAVTRAQVENKNILLIAGGDWCIWCEFMEDFIETNHEVYQAIADNYLVIKVNMSEENENEKFFSRYPEIPGYPHIFVLDQTGEFLHSQGTLALELEGTNTYDPETFLAFLAAWAP